MSCNLRNDGGGGRTWPSNWIPFPSFLPHSSLGFPPWLQPSLGRAGFSPRKGCKAKTPGRCILEAEHWVDGRDEGTPPGGHLCWVVVSSLRILVALSGCVQEEWAQCPVSGYLVMARADHPVEPCLPSVYPGRWEAGTLGHGVLSRPRMADRRGSGGLPFLPHGSPASLKAPHNSCSCCSKLNSSEWPPRPLFRKSLWLPCLQFCRHHFAFFFFFLFSLFIF